MFTKILVANRGEIAVRILRTARRLGIRTVAVYSEADARALHVECADEAVCIGPAPAAQSYLRGDAILEVAQHSRAQAIHPGYGFLSENAAFAASCATAGVAFIGPPVEAIRVMGSKSESKKLMSGAGVPLVPGYHGAAQDLATLAAAAAEIGYPVLVKASAGGGGKGMRIVHAAVELADAVAGAQREALSAFADATLLLEKYLARARHVEIQVFADTQGHFVYLFERDCSIQRRHQKVIEEAPAPALPAEIRVRMGAAAIAAARAVNYVGAGTVEFLYAGGSFYFIEMNTRLQVEHPVTEMITGLDLVEWQLRVAAGEPLPLLQRAIEQRGHAFEARIYAEDPRRGFLPAVGRLTHLAPPVEDRHLRLDSGVREGDTIPIHYDPLLAKLVVWDEDRAAALRRLGRALADYEVAGVTTNIEFLGAIAAHPAFDAGEIDTGFIERNSAALIPATAPVGDDDLALLALAVLLRRNAESRATPSALADPGSPWRDTSGWRLNADNHHELRLRDGAALREVVMHFRRDAFEIELPGGRRMVAQQAALAGRSLTAVLDGVRLRATVVADGQDLVLLHDGRSRRVQLDDPMARAAEQAGGSGRLTAPMPGVIVAVLVQAGEAVARHQPLIVLEAMKMEHTMRAPAAGVVAKLNVRVGEQVTDGTELLVIEAAVS